MLTIKQKKELKKEAHQLKPIFQIGKDGITNEQVKGIVSALNNRELIKVKLLDTSPIDTNTAAIDLSYKTKSEIVQIIGHTVILYKEKDE